MFDRSFKVADFSSAQGSGLTAEVTVLLLPSRMPCCLPRWESEVYLSPHPQYFSSCSVPLITSKGNF